MNAQPFDTLAPTYDADFSERVIGAWLRSRTHGWLDGAFGTGDRVLELGCGTGLDALYLARRGVRVTATDASPAMLDRARARLGEHPGVICQPLDLRDLPDAGFPGPFDGAFASFGPLNLLEDWQPLAAWLAARIAPGGRLLFGVMGPVCLWEIGWFAAHGKLRTALRRFARQPVFRPPGGGPAVPLAYPTPARLTCAFDRYFRRRALYGLGFFLPPSEVFAAVESRPCLLRTLTRLETHLAANPLAAHLADHYWITFERRP